jgi:hypothetical protein
MTKNARRGLAKLQRLAAKFGCRQNCDIAASFRNTMSRPTIELLRPANGSPIVVPAGHRVRVFPVETNFHRMARRPGGVSRPQALRNARTECERMARRILAADQTP